MHIICTLLEEKALIYLHLIYVPARDYPRKVATTREIKIVFKFSKLEREMRKKQKFRITGEVVIKVEKSFISILTFKNPFFPYTLFVESITKQIEILYRAI